MTLALLFLALSHFLLVAGCFFPEKAKPNLDQYYHSALEELPLYSVKPQKGTINSLWSANQVSFFQKNRAQKVGDIVTVLVSIQDSASLDNSTDMGRQTKTKSKFNAFFGITDLIPNFPLKPDLSVEGEMEAKSKGKLDRSENISLQVAAMIVRVLPNGNFIVRGDQTVNINAQARTLGVIGIVRPQDIDSQNRILHTKMANARIFYGDSGLNGGNMPPYGMEVYGLLVPF